MELSAALGECGDLADCLRKLLGAALDLKPFDRGGLYLADCETGEMALTEQAGFPDGTGAMPERFAAGEGWDVWMPVRAGGRLAGAVGLAVRESGDVHPGWRCALEGLVAMAQWAVETIWERQERLRLERELGRVLENGLSGEWLAGIDSLRLALESSGAGIREVDLVSGKMTWDARGLAMVGYEEHEDVTLERLIEERILPAHRQRLAEQLEKITKVDGGDDWDHEFPILHPVSGERWINSRGKVVRDGSGRAIYLIGIILDVTGRWQTGEMLREWERTLERRAEERTRELRESEARFRVLAEASLEGVVISRDGVVRDANPRIAEMIGCDVAEMLGRPVVDFVPPGERERVMARMRVGDEEPYRSTLLRKDGVAIPIHCRARMAGYEGHPARVTVLRDLSEAEHMALERESQRAECERALGPALVSEISAGIVHQLGDPLDALERAICPVAELMRACPECETGWLETMGDVESDLRRMREIVVHLRSLVTPAEPGCLMMVRLDDLLGEVLPPLAREAEIRRVALKVDAGCEVPPVRIDAVLIKQVVINLVRNAIDACDGVPVERRLVTVSMRLRAEQGVELAVLDTGVGLSRDLEGRLFTPFLSTKPNGVGIGLRLCQTIIHAHQGTISGTPNPGGAGACFTVVLPWENHSPS